MTILAGVFSRSSSLPIPEGFCESLRTIISRDPDDRPIEFRGAQAFLIKVDIGAFDRPAHRLSPGGSIAMLAGEPLLTCEGPHGHERDAHLEYMQTGWEAGDFRSLRSTSGTFCAAFYDPRTDTALLVADRLGLRPLYYAAVGDFVYFASALRILEALREVPKEMDVLSVAEITGFGYPFGGGTPYADIKMLLPCEMVTVRRGELTSSRYFDWGAVAPLQATEKDALRETHRMFQSAVRRRLRGDRTTFAYLSGGLDSRCTVAALLAEGARVYTFNFAPEGTQDQVFAVQYAARSGAIHHESPTGPDPHWSAIMADAWRSSPLRGQQMPEHSNVVWTGEGGSVGLGHVYVTPEIVSLLRSGDLSGAIDVFLQQQKKSILTKILNPELGSRLHGHLHLRLRRELEAIPYPDPVRAFFIFLNMNGPRRHLVNHFETIDQHRLEFQLPFYDSELLEYLTTLSVEPFLYHRFYVKWLSFFSPAVREVPWQAYPGHVASTTPVPDDLPDQWNGGVSRRYRLAHQRDLLGRSAAMLSEADFPGGVLRKSVLQLMRWATKLRLGDYGYALEAALVYQHYWKVSGGRCKLLGSPDSLSTSREQAGG